MANVKLSTKAVGSIVKIKVNGAAKDFIIVHQGLPSSAYDASCNGVWVVMKDIYTTSTFGNNNSYKDSGVHTYLNGTFYNLIDSQIRAVILNGSHTIQITASDGKESTSLNATFTKSVTSATVTLTTPLAVDGDITVAVLQVTGSIPDDATFKVEVTNNANDPSPVWQDATVEVKKGVNIVFTNSTAANGAAFNFRVSVSRGASGTGGYIEAISGAFQ